MECPVDKNDMIVVEHKKIELDLCLKCSGVWLDSGELELLAALLGVSGSDSSQDGVFVPREARVTEARRRCPVCKRRMDKVWLGKDPGVLADSCPAGDGLWLDGGELHQVLQGIEHSGELASENVLSFLGDAFRATYGTDSNRQSGNQGLTHNP